MIMFSYRWVSRYLSQSLNAGTIENNFNYTIAHSPSMQSSSSDTYRPFIDGEYHDGTGTFEVENPSTGEAIAVVGEAGKGDVDAALESAQRAQPEWAGLDPGERGRILHDVARALEDHVDELAKLATEEIGRPISQSKSMVGGAINYLDYYAGATDKIEGETIPVPGNRQAFTRREPLGVSAQIIPWNAPLTLCQRGVAPALAAGNVAVVKPAPEAPRGIIRMAEIASEAGLPDGVFNVVPGGGPTTGAMLTEDPRVNQITFTGSVATGTIVGKTAMERVVPTALELGGKSPAIVFDDADLDDAVGGAIKALTMLSGQVCYATTRMFVHEGIYDEFRASLIEAVESLSIGQGADDPDVGPLISGDALSKVVQHVNDALEDGAVALTGGQRVNRDGHFYEPTVIEGAPDDAPISCEEVFGPVINLYEFADEDEAIRRANDTEYGLYATVWTNTFDRGHRVANAVEAGSVMINQYSGSNPPTPFGGYKKSGLGREKGMQALEHYTELKTVNFALGE